MKLLDVLCELPLLHNVPVELVPIAGRGELGAWEFGERVKEEAVYIKASYIYGEDKKRI